ncbi:hypothetical protein Leryth_027480 [Lithospermum erythrorhizon]|nr:hypothetical protein Leryth_027480 [Lithospermum erythrorhizon]
MSFYLHFLILLISFPLVIAKIGPRRSTTGQNPDSFVLSCGASKDATDDVGRIWSPDSKFLTSNNNSDTANAQSQDPSLPSVVPYMTARIFKSQSTYTFPVSPKDRHWIRLHFYPDSYNNHNPANAIFSVNANEFTLLNNFSAYETANALTQAYIVREFTLIPIPFGTLNLTFNPSATFNNSFSFVNGIELISMPEIFQAAPMVGFSDQSMDVEFNTLQTMFRINIGGQFIQGSNDSDTSRTWYEDTPYLLGAAAGVTFQADKNVSIQYSQNVTKYIAPVDVYKTARSMGPDGNVNKNYNLTWIFQVDVNFTYLVRLHFCELQFSKINQRVFDVYINNQTAIEAADVIAFSGAKGVPVYKDYTIYLKDQKNGDDNLWIALNPSVSVKPQYYDSILNGLEIFKINDTKGNLAGPNPQPSELSQKIGNEEPKSFEPRKRHNGPVISAVIGSIAGIGLFLGIFSFVVHRKKRGSPQDNSNSYGWLPIYGGSSSGTKNTGSGFGKVFKGTIDKGMKVAVKRSNSCSEQGVNEFLTEIDLLSKLRHRHLVSLIGACDENNEMILVYDYMANGTLREHLHKTNNTTLSWKQRLDICIGAARGLHYLHTGAKHTIIHRDVKTTNILLDDKWVAKVSDFGLSKTGPGLHQTHISTVVKGSFGYLDPEYFRRQQLTDKSDVYSFGVVLFEVLSGRPPLNPSLPKEQVSLADWAQRCCKEGTLEDIIDPHIKDEITIDCLTNFAETAANCLSDYGTDRPSMGSVLWNLEYALQLQQNPDGPQMVAEQKANDAYTRHETHLNMEDCDLLGDQSSAPNAVFSQIVNPQGR